MSGPNLSPSDSAKIQNPKVANYDPASSRFGISAKLQVAFGIVVGLTVIAATTALLSFSAIEDVLQQFAGHQVPVMTDSMRLSSISGDISAAAARFISAKTVHDQETTLALIARKRADLQTVMERIRKANGENLAFDKFVALSQRLEANIGSLEEAISERTNLHTQITTLLDALRRLHTQIIEILAQHSNQNQALEISEKVLLIVSLLSEGATIREPAELKPIQDRFKAAVESLGKMTSTSSNENLKKATSQLGYFGQGETSVFARHARELFTTTRIDGAIDENVAIQRELDGIVAALVSEPEQGMEYGTVALFENISNSRMLLLLVVLASIVAAALAVNHVQRKLVLRLLSVENAMRRLSSGEIQFTIPAAVERDEISRMADSLEVFRASEIERRGLAERERVEQMQQRNRAVTIDQIIGEFRTTVTSAIGTVTENVSRMQDTARTLSSIAHGPICRHAVSGASEATSTNMRTMAGASDQLDASIREINGQAVQAHSVVQRATSSRVRPISWWNSCRPAWTASETLSSSSAILRNRPICSHSTPPSKPPAQANPAAVLPSSQPKSKRWPARPPARRKTSPCKSLQFKI